MAIEFDGHLPALQEAFQRCRLTLYLGAGPLLCDGEGVTILIRLG